MLNITRLPRVVQFLSNSREFWVTIHNEQSYRELCLMLKKLKKEKRICRARSDRGQKSFSHLKQFFWNHWKWLKLQVSAAQKKLHRKGTASHADRKKIKNKWEKQPANQCPRYGLLVRHGYPTQPSKEKKVLFYLALTIYICFSLSQHAKFKEKAVSYSCPYQHCAISDWLGWRCVFDRKAQL